MVGFARTPILMVLLIGACVKSQAVQCGDLLCPDGRVCAKGACVSGSLATAASAHIAQTELWLRALRPQPQVALEED